MCGLYGFYSNKPHWKNAQAVKGLGIAMQSRGSHSTGIAVIRGDKTRIIKDVVPATKFFNEKPVDIHANAVIGHTRLATMGEKTVRNAHPFQRGNIIGAHNGQVWNHRDVKKDDYEVDSEVIFQLLQFYNNDYKRAFKDLRGSMAVTWTNGKNLYLVRHNNPLFVARNGHAIYWASERDPLVHMCNFLGISAEIWGLEEDKVYKVTPDLKIQHVKVNFKEYSYAPYKRGESNWGKGYRTETDAKGKVYTIPVRQKSEKSDEDELEESETRTPIGFLKGGTGDKPDKKSGGSKEPRAVSSILQDTQAEIIFAENEFVFPSFEHLLHHIKSGDYDVGDDAIELLLEIYDDANRFGCSRCGRPFLEKDNAFLNIPTQEVLHSYCVHPKEWGDDDSLIWIDTLKGTNKLKETKGGE